MEQLYNICNIAFNAQLRFLEIDRAVRGLGLQMELLGMALNSIEGIDTPSAPTTCTCEEECICD